MPNAQHCNRCPVYLHPAAAKSPALIEAIQRETGLLVIANLKRPPVLRSRAQADQGPWGGDAA